MEPPPPPSPPSSSRPPVAAAPSDRVVARGSRLPIARLGDHVGGADGDHADATADPARASLVHHAPKPLVSASAWRVNHGISWRASHQRTPSSYEVANFARFIGMDPVADGPLLWIAEEALCAPLPAGWEEDERPDGTPTYRHESGQVSEHHPLEEHYRAVVAGLRDRPSTPSARAPPRGAADATEIVPPTPNEVRAMAEFLGVDPLDEFPLLSLAYEAVAAPLPGRWVELACEDEAQYFEKDTANLRTTHPADSAIFDELERSRSAARAHTRAADDAAAAAAGRSLTSEGGGRVRDEAAYWMHFHDVEGRGYYYNWLTGRQLSHGPEQQNIAATKIQAAWRRCRWRKMWSHVKQRCDTLRALRTENATVIQRAWRSNWRRRQLRCAATAIRWHTAAITVQRYGRGWLYRRDWDSKLLLLLRRLCRRLTREVAELRLALRRGEAVAAQHFVTEDRLMRRTLVRWHVGRRFRKWAKYTSRQANLRVLQHRIAGRFKNTLVGAAYARWVEMVDELASERAARAAEEREQAAQHALQQMRTAREQLAEAEQRRAEAERRTTEAERERLVAEERAVAAERQAESERWMKRDGWARAGQRAHREAATAWEATAAARQAATQERQMLLEARAAAEAEAAEAMGSVAENLASIARRRKEDEVALKDAIEHHRRDADARVAAAQDAARRDVAEAAARAQERVAAVEAAAAAGAREAAAAAEQRCKQQLELQTQRAVTQVKQLAAKEVARARAEVYSKAKEEVEQALLWLGFPAAAAATATANLRHRNPMQVAAPGIENQQIRSKSAGPARGSNSASSSEPVDKEFFERFRIRSAPAVRQSNLKDASRDGGAHQPAPRQAWSVSLFE